jgi:hypothetical protein
MTINSHTHTALSGLHKLRDSKWIKHFCASVATKHKKQNYNGTTNW